MDVRYPRTLASLLAAAGLWVMAASAALAASYTVSGTVVGIDQGKQTIIVTTSDIIGKEQPITIDMSKMSDQFQDISLGAAVSLQVEARESDTYLAVGPGSDDSYAARDTQGASIRAHVGNVPDDDEALNQQHRDNELRRGQEDNPSNDSGSSDSGG